MSSEIKKEPVVTETAVSSRDGLAVEEAASAGPDRDLKAAIYTIVCGVALPCIPIIVISGVLLGVIFKHQVTPANGWPELHIDGSIKSSTSAIELLSDIRHHGGKWAYYTAYNPSTVTTIASWTGRVIPYLSSSIMALVAFFSARRIVTKSKHGDGTDLPTPEQFALLISLLGGNSFGPLRDTVAYRWAKKERLVDPVPTAFMALFLVTFIGLLIPIVDTWFGVAVHPAVITQLYNNTDAYHSFGLEINKTRCTNNTGSYVGAGGLDGLWGGEWKPCNLASSLSGPSAYVGMYGGDEASRIAAGLSQKHAVLNHTTDNNETYFYLTDARLDRKVDFKAETYAISTQCKPVTSKCQPGTEWPYVREDYSIVCSRGFNTSFGFTGKVQRKVTKPSVTPDEFGILPDPEPLVGIGFSPDNKLSSRVGAWDQAWHDANNATGNGETPQCLTDGPGSCYEYVLPNNPLHFATWSAGYPTLEQMGDDALPPLLDDHEIFQSLSGPTYWVLQCSATVYHVNYTWSNGTINTFDAKLASAEMGGLISGPFAFSLAPAQIAMTNIANLAGLSKTSKELAEKWSEGFSQAALAMSIGALAPQVNDIEQLRNYTIAVARIPILPLYFLLGFKLVYVVAVISLAIGAYCFTHPAETEIVKAQLSTKGLAAAHFDTPGLLQGNTVKALQDQIQPPKRASTMNDVEEREAGQELKRANTAPAPATTDKKVGLVLDSKGAWQFATVANGIWQSVKPIAENLVLTEARAGNMGGVGDVINAWK